MREHLKETGVLYFLKKVEEIKKRVDFLERI